MRKPWRFRQNIITNHLRSTRISLGNSPPLRDCSPEDPPCTLQILANLLVRQLHHGQSRDDEWVLNRRQHLCGRHGSIGFHPICLHMKHVDVHFQKVSEDEFVGIRLKYRQRAIAGKEHHCGGQCPLQRCTCWCGRRLQGPFAWVSLKLNVHKR
jgi:hypothetical protein